MTIEELLARVDDGPAAFAAHLDARVAEIMPALAREARELLMVEMRAAGTSDRAMFLALIARELFLRLGDGEAELESHLDLLNILYVRTEEEREYADYRTSAIQAAMRARDQKLPVLALRGAVLACECALHAFMLAQTPEWRATTLADGMSAVACCGATTSGSDFDRLVYVIAHYPALADGSDVTTGERELVARAAAWVRKHVPEDWSFSADPVVDAEVAQRLTDLTEFFSRAR